MAMGTEKLLEELRKHKRLNAYRKIHLMWHNKDGCYHVLSTRFKKDIKRFLEQSEIEIGFTIS
jgi:hypothetical protein